MLQIFVTLYVEHILRFTAVIGNTSDGANRRQTIFIVAPCISYSHLICTPTSAHKYNFYIKTFKIAPLRYKNLVSSFYSEPDGIGFNLLVLWFLSINLAVDII